MMLRLKRSGPVPVLLYSEEETKSACLLKLCLQLIVGNQCPQSQGRKHPTYKARTMAQGATNVLSLRVHSSRLIRLEQWLRNWLLYIDKTDKKETIMVRQFIHSLWSGTSNVTPGINTYVRRMELKRTKGWLRSGRL